MTFKTETDTEAESKLTQQDLVGERGKLDIMLVNQRSTDSQRKIVVELTSTKGKRQTNNSLTSTKVNMVNRR